ncbi:MAG: CoA-binding protein [Anaerolineales bacterium]
MALRAEAPDKRAILEQVKTIAVVGLSRRDRRPGYYVPAYMHAAGYRIIPVNPYLEEAFGEKAYPDLLSIPEPVDMVVIFRRSEDVPPVVDQAIEIGAKVVWMQLGIVNEEAAAKALAAGLQVVMNSCIKIDHQRLFGGF